MLRFAMPRRDGFTLLELCLGVVIALMLVLIAVPSVRSVLEEQRLHRSFEAFDALVTKARMKSINERRAYALAWRDEGIELLPLEKKEGEQGGAEPETLPFSKEEEYALERPAAMGEKPPPIWTFWRSGACEPVIVSYTGPEGAWKARYDALTARRTILEERLK